ncbi:hydrogenase maturation nickel metallochaperone HypA [Vibrio mangrovi]|uniref:Hydrogenase maturation factor HypA n=1 Tax=Vibrio mangrovi TaxID=474394 RepID=A0A1Y6IXQ9_9VIBR|nr:hydrogenase maturation nickel metallochaperone HypA [Vibrio mangrovi]MDW6002019.1 hydrogenase maturation nickel metallochaperone HypA [Vibrio mangrovi]SMS02434.1 Hydrogenase/urease nickel incorporation protein HypA [Vibrio mangrovi]
MHELSLSLKTIDLVVEHARRQECSRVTAVTLGIGRLSCIEPEALLTGLQFASRDTLAEGAQFKVDMIPAIAWCEHCHQQVEIDSHYTGCPVCHQYQLVVETGEELKIKSIEVESYV